MCPDSDRCDARRGELIHTERVGRVSPVTVLYQTMLIRNGTLSALVLGASTMLAACTSDLAEDFYNASSKVNADADDSTLQEDAGPIVPAPDDWSEGEVDDSTANPTDDDSNDDGSNDDDVSNDDDSNDDDSIGDDSAGDDSTGDDSTGDDPGDDPGDDDSSDGVPDDSNVAVDDETQPIEDTDGGSQAGDECADEHGADGGACTPQTVCAPGTFAVPGEADDTEWECSVCPLGTFSEVNDAEECQEWTTCEPGEYVTQKGNAAQDRLCEPCPAGENSAADNAAACYTIDGCPAGAYSVTAPTEGPTECAPCDVGYFCEGGFVAALACEEGTWDDDQDPTTPCVAHTQCPVGSFVEVTGSAVQDATCAECLPGTFSTEVNAQMCQTWQTCAAGTYVSAAGSSTSDVECNGCMSGTYSSTQDAADCAPWTDCQQGEYVEASGDATTDRQCAPCPMGQFSDTLNAGSCAAPGQCAAGTLETAPATQSSDATCEPCAAGNYCAGGQAQAVACGPESWDDDADPATPCVAKRACAAGQYVVSDGDSTTNRSCSPCAADQYSTTMNAPSCTSWSNCAPGKYVSTQGSSVSDRVCSNCPAGQYSSSNNVLTCTNWATCNPPSSYQTQAPSATQDRQCGSCTPPQITRATNETTCSDPAFQMSNGQVVMEAENEDGQAINGSNHYWSSCSHSGISGGCMEAVGDYGYTFNDAVATFSPRLDYKVNFTSTGTFHVWIRGDNGNGSPDTGNSCWAGIDNTVIGTPHTFAVNSDVWGWTSQTINVTSTGIHTLNVWIREDGFQIDKIVVKTSSTAPTGNGPSESPR